MRLLFGAECRDACVQGFRVVALVALHDFVVALAGVKCVDLCSNQFAKAAGEGVPELNFCFR